MKSRDNIFHGQWISGRDFGDTAEKSHCRNYYMKVRRSLFIDDITERIFIRITADDYYKLYLNGKYVCQGPPQGYDFAYYYNEVDITPYIIFGKENLIEVTVYYQGLINRAYVSGDNKQGMIADIFTKSRVLLSTDSSWLCKRDESYLETKPYGYDTQFPERRDFTREAEAFVPCREIPCPYKFVKEPYPVVSRYKAEYKAEKTKNRIFYTLDGERVATAYVVCTAEKDGEELKLRFAEELNNDGSLRYELRCGCHYEDTYILRKGINIIDQMEYKGFRYAEILCENTENITEADFYIQHHPFTEKTMEIDTSEESLRRIFSLCKDTLKYSVQEIIPDCPTREKGQYSGDLTVAGLAFLYLTGDPRPIKKALRDFCRSIDKTGNALAVAPCSYRQKIADYALQLPFNVMRYYRFTKDETFLREMLPYCRKTLEIFRSYENSSGLIENVTDYWNLVDWPEGCRDGYEADLRENSCPGIHNVINAFYVGAHIATEEIADILGVKHKKRASLLKEAFNNSFFDKSTLLYTDIPKGSHSSLHSNILPVSLGISTPDTQTHPGEFIYSKGFSCGAYMSYFALRGLCRLGEYEKALNLMTNESPRGWMNMLREGATTCFEAWSKQDKWNTSLCHPWATAPICIISEEPDFCEHNGITLIR